MLSTKKPVPWPDSLITVTTVFLRRLNCSVRSPPELSPARAEAGAEISSLLALSLVRSTFCWAPVMVSGTLQENERPPSSAGLGVVSTYFPGGSCASTVPSRPVFTSVDFAPFLSETSRKGTGFWFRSWSTRITRTRTLTRSGIACKASAQTERSTVRRRTRIMGTFPDKNGRSMNEMIRCHAGRSNEPGDYQGRIG